jgi:hypothetical protein
LEPKLIDVATDNLTSLHKYEEQLRARSLAVIEADAGLSDHWNLVAEAMGAIYAFSHDHPHESEDELTFSGLPEQKQRPLGTPAYGRCLYS